MKLATNLLKRIRYRIGASFVLFILIYLAILGSIIFLSFKIIGGKNIIYALPALIIGYDRLFSIIRRGFSYGFSKVNAQKEANQFISDYQSKITFVKTIFKLFYFWQEKPYGTDKLATWFTQWNQIKGDLQATLNFETKAMMRKYQTLPDYKQFVKRHKTAYYFKNFDSIAAQIALFYNNRNYLSLKKAFAQLEAATEQVRKIFQFLNLIIDRVHDRFTSLTNNNSPTQMRQFKLIYADYQWISQTTKNLLLSNSLTIALEILTKKCEKLI